MTDEQMKMGYKLLKELEPEMLVKMWFSNERSDDPDEIRLISNDRLIAMMLRDRFGTLRTKEFLENVDV